MTETASYAAAIEDSVELRLMRQQNLPFVAEVVGRAFSGSTMVEIEEIALLRIIAQVQAELVQKGLDLPQDSEKYLHDWIKPSSGEGWFTTRLDQYNERLIVLKPAGRRVMSFIETLGVSMSRLSESALSTLGGFVTETAARLSGDGDAYIEMLEAQKREIDIRIASVRENGVQGAPDTDREDVAARLSSQISAMVNGFAQIPGEIRAMAQENEEFIQSSEAPLVDRFSEVLDRRQSYRGSAQYKTLEALHEIHVSPAEKERMQRAIEVVVSECRDFLTKEDVRRARTLFPALTRMATKVIEEHATLSRRFEEIFKDPDFAKRHAEARALKGARDAMLALRDHGDLGRRDPRLNEIGLAVPVYPVPGHAVHDIRFARPALLAPIVHETAPLPDFDDFDASLDMTMGQVGKGQFLEKDAIIGRINALRDKIAEPSLCDVVAAYPPQYGTEEIAAYLWIAGSEIPSIYRPGALFDAIVDAGGRKVAIRCPNPVFPAEGTPGEGLEDFLRVTHFAGLDDLLKDLPWNGPRSHLSSKPDDDDLVAAE